MTKRIENKGMLKRVFSVLVVLLIASAMLVGAGSAETVSQVGETPYESIDDAITAWTGAGGTLKLLADVSVSETITVDGDKFFTLDLGGKTLTSNTDKDGIVVSGGATLTLTNSAQEGSLNFPSLGSSSDAIFVSESGTLNIESGVKIDVVVTANSAIHAQNSTYAENSVVVNINGGEITMTGDATGQVGAIKLYGGATLNMYGGTVNIAVIFDTNYDAWSRDACGLVLVNNNNHAFLNGGSFTVKGTNSFAQGVQIATMNGNADNTGFVVDGATFTVNNDGTVGECYPFAIYDPTQGSFEVKSGSVTGNFNGIVSQYLSGEVGVIVSGGSFFTNKDETLKTEIEKYLTVSGGATYNEETGYYEIPYSISFIGDDYTVSGMTEYTITGSQTKTFTLIPADGKTIKEVKAENATITCTDNTYTLSEAKRNVTVTVSVENLYAVSFIGDDYTVSGITKPYTISESEIKTFTLTPVANKKITNVEAINATITNNGNGEYALSVATGTVTITVSLEEVISKDTGSSSSSGSSVWLTEPATPTPTSTPTETTTPTDAVPTDIPVTQPTATPETPGFGVLAVLAGLGAVAVLRRK